MNIKKLMFSAIAVVAVLVALFVGIGIYNTPANRVNRHLELANRYLEEMEYEQAIVEFDKAIDIDSMSVDAYLGKAQAYEGMGDVDMAIVTLETAYDLTGDERLKTKIDELNSVAAVTENQTVPEAQEVIEESIHTEYSFYDIDEMSVLGCSIWDEDWFQNVCGVLGCPIIEKETSSGIGFDDGVEGQFGPMVAEHNIDAVDTGAASYSLSIDMDGYHYPAYEEFFGDLQMIDWSGGNGYSLYIFSPQVDTALFGNLPFNVGDTYELWYQVMNIEDIKSIGKEQVEVYEEYGYTLFSYYYRDGGGGKYSSCTYLEYTYEDANRNRYSFQVNSNGNRQLDIAITVHNGAISQIYVHAWGIKGN